MLKKIELKSLHKIKGGVRGLSNSGWVLSTCYNMRKTCQQMVFADDVDEVTERNPKSKVQDNRRKDQSLVCTRVTKEEPVPFGVNNVGGE